MKEKKGKITASADHADAFGGERVPLCEMLSSEEFRQSEGLPVALGRDAEGKDRFRNLLEMRHQLLTGGTDAERTAYINAALLSLLCRCSPADLRMMIFDPEKQLEVYRGLPHLQGDFIAEEQIIIALAQAINEMNRRYGLFYELTDAGIPTHSFKEYNAIPSVQKLPLLLVVLNVRKKWLRKKDFSNYLCSLAQKCWAAGVCVILATDRSTSENNFITHITFPSSRRAGKGKGKLSMSMFGTPELCVQGASVTSAELSAAVAEIKAWYRVHSDLVPADVFKKKDGSE